MQGTKIIVTGATGFLGSNIVRQLLGRGAFVYGIVRLSANLSRLTDAKNNPNLKLVETKDVLADFSSLAVDGVIHTATQYGRRGESSEEIIEANETLPKELWDALRNSGSGFFINTDTFMPADVSLDDRYYMYAKTKKNFLSYATSTLSDNLKFINLVVYHMYGPGDNTTKFLPWVIGEMKQNTESIDLSPGDQTRDFIFIDDVVSAFMRVLDKKQDFKNFEEFHIGTGREHGIKEAVETLKQYLGSTTELTWGARQYQSGEIMHACADISKNGTIEWKAEVSLNDGLKRTAEYYKENNS